MTTFNINDPQKNNTKPTVFVMLNVEFFFIDMLIVIMPDVVMLCVVAPVSALARPPTEETQRAECNSATRESLLKGKDQYS
jgi:hypothetical protein